jgi:hypothetical protein
MISSILILMFGIAILVSRKLRQSWPVVFGLRLLAMIIAGVLMLHIVVISEVLVIQYLQ